MSWHVRRICANTLRPWTSWRGRDVQIVSEEEWRASNQLCAHCRHTVIAHWHAGEGVGVCRHVACNCAAFITAD